MEVTDLAQVYTIFFNKRFFFPSESEKVGISYVIELFTIREKRRKNEEMRGNHWWPLKKVPLFQKSRSVESWTQHN